MAIRYRKVQNNNPSSESYGKWYGRAIVMDTISTKQLAKEISYSTTVTYPDVLAVLTALANSIQTHLQESHKVVLDDIGAMRIGLQTSPADTSADFTANNIKGYRIVFQPFKKFVPTGVNANGNRTGVYVKEMLDGITAKEAPKNAVVDDDGKTKTQG